MLITYAGLREHASSFKKIGRLYRKPFHSKTSPGGQGIGMELILIQFFSSLLSCCFNSKHMSSENIWLVRTHPDDLLSHFLEYKRAGLFLFPFLQVKFFSRTNYFQGLWYWVICTRHSKIYEEISATQKESNEKKWNRERGVRASILPKAASPTGLHKIPQVARGFQPVSPLFFVNSWFSSCRENIFSAKVACHQWQTGTSYSTQFRKIYVSQRFYHFCKYWRWLHSHI